MSEGKGKKKPSKVILIFIQKQVCCTACADNVILLKLLRYLTLEGKKNAYFHAVCQTCVGSIRSAAARRIEEGEGVLLNR